METSTALARAVCRDCGFAFDFDAGYYLERALSCPTRCRRCRSARRTVTRTSPIVTGTVTSVGEHFAFIADESGRQFFGHRNNTALADWPLQIGEAVTFTPATDARDYCTPGKSPRAYAIRRASGGPWGI